MLHSAPSSESDRGDALDRADADTAGPHGRRRGGRRARRRRYRNAGTIEFLLEGKGDSASFYFLEMNTRLQVEHPITEQVVGVDLAAAQIRIAAARPLPWTQKELSQRGHAIELRIYAEDPAQGYLPQAGPLALYREPAMPGVRIDSGFAEGDEVSVHYDPLIAKLIASGDTREAARQRAVAATQSFPILGIRTNTAFCWSCCITRVHRRGDRHRIP
jgi:acetyl/propionyl-CoA carboxylase alpha subunit